MEKFEVFLGVGGHERSCFFPHRTNGRAFFEANKNNRLGKSVS